MRRDKGLEWIVLVAVMTAPAMLYVKWRSSLPRTPSGPPLAAAAAKTPPPAPPPPPAAPPDETPAPPTAAAEPAAPSRDPMLSPYDRILMNPPEPPPVAVVVPPKPPKPGAGIRLEGVIIADDQPRKAIVNGSVVQEGGKVKGATVLRIGRDAVIFRKNGRKFTKSLSD